MKIKLIALLLVLIGCNQAKDGQQSPAADSPPANSSQQETRGLNQSNLDNPVLGEWFQQYAVLDQNRNTLLDSNDRNGTKSTMGINYFQFNEDGRCLYDSDMKFKGTYEILDENGKQELNVTVNGFGETYKYTIINPVTDELILYSSGAFMIYKRK